MDMIKYIAYIYKIFKESKLKGIKQKKRVLNILGDKSHYSWNMSFPAILLFQRTSKKIKNTGSEFKEN